MKIIEIIHFDVQGRSMYLLGRDIFHFYHSHGMGWLRIWNGKGIAWKNTKVHRLLFSERNGYAKRIQIGKWSIKYLKP